MSDFELETLHEYNARVRAAASAKSGEPIYNSSPAHAEIILTNLWGVAGKHVSLLSQSLSERVYNRDSVIEAAQKFLSRDGASATILFEDKPQQTNRFYKAMMAQGNVTIKQVDKDTTKLYDYSLMVADDDSYRFAEDKYEMAAVAAFGDVENAKNLLNVFNQIDERSVVVA